MATFPERALAWLNSALTVLVDFVLGPLLGLPAAISLLIVALATAAAMLPVVARTSDQKRLVQTKRGIHAALFEIRLFNDDLRAVLRALGDALRHNAMYLRLSLVPLAWMALPLTLLVAQLHAVYGYSGLEVGVPAIIKVELRPGAASGGVVTDAVLEVPQGLRLETGAVHLATLNEVLWRIVPTAEGDYTITVRIGESATTKNLRVWNGPARRSPRRVSPGLLDQLLYPSEAPLPAAGRIAAISVAYPEPGLNLLGWRVHWMIAYAALFVVAAVILARRFGITL